MDIQKLINDNRPNYGKHLKQFRYFQGDNPTIWEDLPKSEPDNRIPIPIARRAVLLTKGYMAKPGNITYSEPIPYYDENDEQLETANALEKALTFGRVYELHWTENNTPMFEILPIDQCIPIFTKSLKPKLESFIWHRTSDKERATYYDEFRIIEFVKEKTTWIQENEMPHGYGQVPINIGYIDSDKRNMFDHCTYLIDTLDAIISQDYANELQRFANAYLLLRDTIDGITEDENGRTQLDKIKEYKVFDNLKENVTQSVAFLERNINGAFIAESAERIERLIYEMLMIFNPNEKDFSGTSGISQAYKLLGFEYFCSNVESYFVKFLQNRLRLISSITKNLGLETIDPDIIQISLRRNLPFDIQSIATMASTLMGVWDLEAILNLFPQSVLTDEDKKRILQAKEDEMSLPEVTDNGETEPVQQIQQ